MPRLIDADTAKREFNLYFGGVSDAVIAGQILDELPTLDPVHAAGGVYCRECKYQYDYMCPMYDEYNDLNRDAQHKEDAFCSYGVKKETHKEFKTSELREFANSFWENLVTEWYEFLETIRDPEYPCENDGYIDEENTKKKVLLRPKKNMLAHYVPPKTTIHPKARTAIRNGRNRRRE